MREGGFLFWERKSTPSVPLLYKRRGRRQDSSIASVTAVRTTQAAKTRLKTGPGWQNGAVSAIVETMNKTKRNAWHKHLKLDAKMKARKQTEAKAEKK